MIGVAVGLLLLWLLMPSGGPSIRAGSILVVPLSGSYVEAIDPPLLTRLLTDADIPFVALLSELKKAERDDRLSSVILRIRALEIGWGQAHELRQALRRLSAAGRRPIAYLELADFSANLEYYVASAADEIHISPAAVAGVVGLAGEYLFLGRMWENLGVDFDIAQAGRYKSAVETIAGDEMSDPHREEANAILDSIDHQFVSGIAEGRGVTPQFVRQAIDRGPLAPGELEELGLVDEISFFDELTESLGGPIVEAKDYAQVDLASLGFDPVARFALIYGSGQVVLGSGRLNSMGSAVLASDTVAGALEAAARDSNIQAIIFRIDSPGGSPLASDIVWRAAKLAKRSGKPIIASLSNVAASGGYYVACGADAILATPGTITGSIGAYALRPVVSGLLDKLGVKVETLTRGAHAGLALVTAPLVGDSAKRLRDETDAIYRLFVERVAEGRQLEIAEVEAIAQGRVWTGEQAFERGLIDGVGGLTEAVERAKQALGLAVEADVALVPYPEPGSLTDQISETLSRVAVDAIPKTSLPGIAGRVQDWLETAPIGAPALVPPFVLDIR
jgi:protease-4